MRNENSTKRALLASVLAFLLCVAMFVGSTFAWFTDTASTGVNKIQAGELDVALMMLEDGEWIDAEGGVLDFKAADGRTDILWEPGATYEIPALKVVNDGNLALKYQLLISGVIGDSELADVLDVWVKVDDGEWNKNIGTLSALMAEEDGAAYGIILPDGEAIDETASDAEKAITTIGATNSYTIALHMQEEAGNEYQNLAIEGMSVTVYATQYTYEYDMFDNQYDKDAAYDKSEEEAPVDPYAGYAVVYANNQEELDAAIAAVSENTVIVLSANTYELYNTAYLSDEFITVLKGDENVTVDLTGLRNEFYGNEIIFESVNVKFAESSHKGLTHVNKVTYNNCTISGTQTLYASTEFNNCVFDGNQGKDIYYVWTYGVESATFTDCTFNTSGKAILCYHEATTASLVANVTLTNCVFNDDDALIASKAAVETGSDGGNTATSNKYNLIFTDCEVNGFSTNNSTSALWGNKNSMDADHLNVVINGEVVY